MEEFVIGEENFNEGAQDFLALLKKKQWKNKYEMFFQFKEGAALKLKTNRNY